MKVHAEDGYPVEGVDDPEAWLTPPELLAAWVAVRGERVVGHAALTRPSGEDAVALWLDKSQDSEAQLAVGARLFVAPEARHEGLGERLMKAANTYARERGLRVVLDVMAKDTAAIRLYECLGMQRIGTSTHAYGVKSRVVV
ncbi:GNAT family N-acetyltransferase [Streptomyces flaveus]|uniref:N-acetyltransferase domain-containing protein n=1 Tax=Streptomyces flaveus TaxID=66370 RepID=A0A917RIA8_9ACTN|nr:GNAT family N-acetyltransferase [Streptomyces flaveus]GGL09777.1 hypothetical protein GCM10010094_83230 [Streptomyces flaveus]